MAKDLAAMSSFGSLRCFDTEVTDANLKDLARLKVSFTSVCATNK